MPEKNTNPKNEKSRTRAQTSARPAKEERLATKASPAGKESASRHRAAASKAPAPKAPTSKAPAPKAERTGSRSAQRRRMLFLVSTALALVFVLGYYCVVWVLLGTQATTEGDELPLLLFVDGRREEEERFSADEVWFRGERYLPVTVLERFMPITQFGDHESRSFLLCDQDRYATFYPETVNAILDGERIFLQSPSFLKDEVLYLPVSFYVEKMNCFELDHSSAHAADVLTYLPDEEPDFTLYPFSGCEGISPENLPVLP